MLHFHRKGAKNAKFRKGNPAGFPDARAMKHIPNRIFLCVLGAFAVRRSGSGGSGKKAWADARGAPARNAVYAAWYDYRIERKQQAAWTMPSSSTHYKISCL
jgi:hypothetical protein